MAESTKRIITQIDVLVHPEYNRLRLAKELPIPLGEQDALRQRWFERGIMLSHNANSLLIHHSLFIDHFPGIGDGSKTFIKTHDRPDLWALETERIRNFKMLLGDRYILFGAYHYPSSAELAGLLESREMAIDPDKARVLAYGEYYERCVNYWGENIATSTLARNRWAGRDPKAYDRSKFLSVLADPKG